MRNEKAIDVRSDTSSLPTQEMLEAMRRAKLGNDGYGEDPTVRQLETLGSEKLGKEAALLVASGTMGNLVALLTHTTKGHVIVAEDQAHIVTNERGYADIAGLEVCRLKGHDGRLDPKEVEDAILALNHPNVDLVCMENTHNNAGGTVLSPEEIDRVCEIAWKHGLPTHLDGARVFNASVALNMPARRIGEKVDSIMFCLSKGLCAPIGSLLVGTKEFIEKARKMRTLLGGQMRQAGVIAAAGIVALETMIDRLKEDHDKARVLAQKLSEIDGLKVNVKTVQSNIVLFDVGDYGITAESFSRDIFRDHNIKVNVRGKTLLRAVVYKDISWNDIYHVVDATREVVRKYSFKSL